MEFKLVLGMCLLHLVHAAKIHSPKVHEEIQESTSEIIRKARDSGDTFQPSHNPPTFVFGQQIQQDQQRWRYFQQQRADSDSMSKIRQQLKKDMAFQNRPVPLNNGQQLYETPQKPVRLLLDQRWKVVHPKFVTERQTEATSTEDLTQLETNYFGKRDKPNVTVKRNTTRTSDVAAKKAAPLKKKGANKQGSYRVLEDDLEADGSENHAVSEAVDRQDHINLANNFLANPHTIIIDTQTLEKNVAAGNSLNQKLLQQNAGQLVVAQQKDLNALNSLLGQTPGAQLNGLKQLLHSQAMHVVQLPQDQRPINENVIDVENKQIRPNIKVEHEPTAQGNQLHDSQHVQTHLQTQVLLQAPQLVAQPQALNQLQAQLDAVAQKQAQDAIAQAQQKALDHINSQHQAIALAKIQAEKIALAHVQAQNLALAQAQAEAQAQAQAQALDQKTHFQAIEIKSQQDALKLRTQEEALAQKARQEVAAQQEAVAAQQQAAAAQALALKAQDDALRAQYDAAEQIKAQNAAVHAQLQAEAYSQNYQQAQAVNQQHVVVDQLKGHSGVGEDHAIQNNEQHPYSYPLESVHTGSYLHPEEALRTQEETAQLLKAQNAAAHAQIQAQAYRQLASQAYAQQPVTDVQVFYAHPEKTEVPDESVYEGEHEEYASKYSFGYRIRDFHSGNDFGHEETKDGKVTKGNYHVLLPDGRVQNVQYWADPSGYHAKVSYTNIAHH